MKTGQTLILRTNRPFTTLRYPTTVTYKGKYKEGSFPFIKDWYIVEETYPLGQSPEVIVYETMRLLLEDYQTIEEWEEEESIRQRLKTYCTV